MLGRLRASRASHIPGLYLITTICGLIDAACFLALGGVLAELMTGNLIFFAVGLGSGTASAEQLSRYVTAFVPFVIGAYLGGRILRGPAFLRERRRGFILEWLVIVLATVLTVILHPGESGYPRAIVVGLLALAMGTIAAAWLESIAVTPEGALVRVLTIAGGMAVARQSARNALPCNQTRSSASAMP